LEEPGQPLSTPTLQDDLESFVHVLTWVLLRYTPHCYGAVKLTSRLRVWFDSYDVDPEGNLSGGEDKKSYIITGAVLNAQFNHPILPSLLCELLQTFAVRYLPLPSEDPNPRRQMQRLVNKEAFLQDADSMYKADQANLESSDWMLDRFNEALSDHESWPVADRSTENPLSQEPIPDWERKSQIDSLKPW
jgi:hypothetical protein